MSREAGAAAPPAAPFGPTLALSVAVAISAFALAAPLVLRLIEPTRLAPPFGEQNQDSETLLFILAFAVLLPLAVVLVPRLADGIARAHGTPALTTLAGAALAGLIGMLLLIKLSERLPWGGGREVQTVLAAVWAALLGGVLARTAAGHGGWLRRPSERAWLPWAIAAILAVPLALSFADLGSIALVPALVGILVAGAALALADRDRIPTPRGRWTPWVEGAAVIVLFLAVPNLILFSFEDPTAAVDTSIIQFHQNFFLGPANHVAGGSPVLVDTQSQYGVGSIVFLAGVFQFVPIGNGTLGLLEGVLAATVFVLAYLVLRAAGVSRLLAAGAMTVAVVALVLGLQYRLGGLLQHGAIRFGLPIGVLAAAVVAERWPATARAARIGGLVVVGVASIWALEAFAYTLLTLAGVLAFGAATVPRGERRSWLVRRVAEVAAACVLAHLVFAGATLAASGQLPEWGAYLDTLRSFLVGAIGDLTYDFTPWSPALAVGALYLASAAAVVLLIRRTDLASRPERSPSLLPASGGTRGDRIRPRAGWRPNYRSPSGLPGGGSPRSHLLALSGTTAYGIALFSYFVNRSADHILPYVCLPAVMCVALWLSLLRRPGSGVPVPLARGASGLVAGVAVLLVAVAWSSAGTRFSESALGLAVPGGDSLGGALERLWDRPPLKPGAEEGERLLEQYLPGEGESIVLTDADLGVEVLVRTERINRVPLSDPWEDSLAPDQHLEALAEFVDGLELGDRLLVDAPSLDLFDRYVAEPERDALVAPLSQSTIVPSGIAVLQELVLERIGQRYRLEPVATGAEDLSVVELAPRLRGLVPPAASSIGSGGARARLTAPDARPRTYRYAGGHRASPATPGHSPDPERTYGRRH